MSARRRSVLERSPLARRWAEWILEPDPRHPIRRRIARGLWRGYAGLQRLSLPFRERGPARPRRVPAGDQNQVIPPGGVDGAFFRGHLVEDLLPFWARHAPDPRGGFFHHLDRRGRASVEAPKLAPMQGRLLYTFASGYALTGSERYRRLAEAGLEFLVERFWDEERGGWYRSVGSDGAPLDRDKHAFDQSFVLVGLCELGRATGSAPALEYARRTWEVIELRLRDPRHGGYFERCDRSWEPISSKKTACTHLDLLAAALALRAAGGALPLSEPERIADLIEVRMCAEGGGRILEVFHRDWRYNPLRTGDRLQIGHMLKGGWLLLEAGRLTGEERHLRAGRKLIDESLRIGWDARYGGFYQHVSRSGTVASREKLWWPECEGVIALLSLYRLTGERSYLDRLNRLIAFCFGHLVDPEWGEWFTSCFRDGTVSDDRKAFDWKASMHTTRACVRAIRLLELPEATARGSPR